MLNIEAQSNTAGGRRYRSSGPAADDESMFPPKEQRPSPHAFEVMVTVIHSPLHVGCFLQFPAPPIPEIEAAPAPVVDDRCHCSVFTLASPACAKVFPLRRCDLEGGGGGGAGAALLAAAAARGGRGGGSAGRESGGGLLLSAEDVPKEERLRYR